MNLTKEIKTLALGEGFHKVGITAVRKLKNSSYLSKWITLGYHGSMSWMEKNRDIRIDIKKYFPAARSIICVAHNYFVDQNTSKHENILKISRYARGEDYHKIVKSKLKNLLNKIKGLQPDVKGIVCVDTSPVMEKLWAVRAGIGWQGKHTIIISKEYGSWLFLGEIIIDKYLDYDQPMDNLCGDCTICMDSCPTGAIVAPYHLDARKCISHLTIEQRKSDIPQDLAKKINNWIFGCDICQEVCPWNKKCQHSTGETYYTPKIDYSRFNWECLSKMDKKEFRFLFKDSEIYRLGYDNFIRNVHMIMRSKPGN
jgi:epoxyqueuosine reductase